MNEHERELREIGYGKSTEAFDTRPPTCRFRLQDEGKPYPKSGCEACGAQLAMACGYDPRTEVVRTDLEQVPVVTSEPVSVHEQPPPEQQIAALQAALAQALQERDEALGYADPSDETPLDQKWGPRMRVVNSQVKKLAEENAKLRADLVAALADAPTMHPTTPPVGSVWLHIKTGHVYAVVGYCVLEASNSVAVLYSRPEDDPLPPWARSVGEFMDGRFRRIDATEARWRRER